MAAVVLVVAAVTVFCRFESNHGPDGHWVCAPLRRLWGGAVERGELDKHSGSSRNVSRKRSL